MSTDNLKCLTCGIPCFILNATGCDRLDCQHVATSEEPLGGIDPNLLAQLLKQLYDITGSMVAATHGGERFCLVERVKPAVLMAAVRELEVTVQGQPLTGRYRRLIGHGKMAHDGLVFAYIPSVQADWNSF